MKIVIASDGKTTDDFVSEKGARAPYYLFFEDGELVETMKNPFAVGGGGAGWSVAHTHAEKGVELVVAGAFGKNLETALSQKDIRTLSASGKIIKDVLKEV